MLREELGLSLSVDSAVADIKETLDPTSRKAVKTQGTTLWATQKCWAINDYTEKEIRFRTRQRTIRIIVAEQLILSSKYVVK